MEQNAAISSFYLFVYNNSTIKVCILSRYTWVATNLNIKVLFEVGLSDVWQKKYFSFFKLSYLSFSKAEVSKFASLRWHSQGEWEVIKIYWMSN